MFKSLSPGAIGISASLEEGIKLAKANGFEGIDVSMSELADRAEQTSVGAVEAIFAEAGVCPGAWAPPVDWRGPEDQYQEQLKALPRVAKMAQTLETPWSSTWILPMSEELPFEENFDFHVERFRPIAEILRDYGCRLGLEFIGPKTLRAGAKYEFIYTMDGMLELCAAIGTGNMGLLFDVWHWYTSHGTVEGLRRLTANDVVCVHINDAPAGIPIDEQIDNVRCLPGETGVIDIASCLRTLNDIGYDGPATPEPFSQRLREMSAEDAAKETGESVAKVWRLAGLA